MLGHAKLAHQVPAAGATLQSTHDVQKTAATLNLADQAKDLQSTVAAGHPLLCLSSIALCAVSALPKAARINQIIMPALNAQSD